MSKNYKRHAKAERFQRSNFGDMGLRAYQEQQKTIIDSLKLQNKEFESTRKDFLDSKIDKSRKELDNDKELKKLEEAVWDNKFENKQIRDDRAISALEVEAEDYKKKSKYWADFSSTYSKKYSDAFGKVTGAIDLKMAQNAFEKIKNDDAYEERLEETEFLEFFQADDADKYLDKTLKEKAKTIEEKREITTDIVGIQRFRGGTEQRIAVDDLIGRSQDIITSLLRDLENPEEGEGMTVDQYNVKDIIEYRALEVLKVEGIRWNSKEGMRFMKHMQGKALDNQKRRKNLSDVREDQDNINATILELKTYKNQKDYKNYEVALNKLQKQVGTQKHYDKKSGTFGIVEMDPKQKYLASIELLADHGIITNIWQAEQFADIAHPDQKHIGDLVGSNIEAAKNGTLKDTRRTWWQRHPTLKNDIDLILAEKNASKNTKDKILKAQTDVNGVSFIENGLKDGSINPQDDVQISKLKEEYSLPDKRGNGKALNKLNELSVFSTIGVNDKTGAILNEKAVTDLAKDGKTAQFRDLISNLPPKIRVKYEEMLSGLEFADRNNLTKSDIRTWALGELNAYQQLKDIQNIKDGDFIQLLDDTIQDVYYHISVIDGDNTKNDTQKKEWVLNAVKQRIKDGVGIYSRDSDTGGVKTIWTAYNTHKTERNELSDDKIINKKLEMGTESFLDEVDLRKVTVLKQDWIDTWEKSNLKGEAIETPDIVDKLWKAQNKLPLLSQYLTKRQIFNKLLKSSGATFEIPEGAEEKNLSLAQRITMMIPDYLRMSLEDQERVICYQDILKLDKGDPYMQTEMCKERVRKDEEADRIRQEILEANRNLSPNLRKDGSGDRWDTLNLKEQLEFEKLLKV